MSKSADDILIEVKGVSKKFSRSLKRSMAYGMRDIAAAMLGIKKDRSVLRNQEFWAVKDVSFNLRRGECLGLIGRNGAGKSTLLKMLNGLIMPDEGSITMRGKIGALIELGAGFNPLLTGRENIFINGQLLGFTKKEVEEKLSAILEFADIGEFIDSPVQNYSSGMKVRLGFGIAAQMEPDVLIIDEVLAVGDLGFVLKCFNTIDNLLQNTAVIFVSHNMPQVSRICTSILLMEKGKMRFLDNDVSKGIDLYYTGFGSTKSGQVIFSRNDDAELLEVKLGTNGDVAPDNGKDIFGLNRLDDLHVSIALKVNVAFPHPSLALTFHDKEQRPIAVCMDKGGLKSQNIVKTENGFNYFSIQLHIPHINLSKGIYSISLSVSEELMYKPILRLNSVREFLVYSEHNVWQSIEFEGKWS